MPEFTGMLGGLLGIQAFQQEQAQRQAQIEDTKAQVQQRQIEVQQAQMNMGMQKAQQDVISNFLKQGAMEKQGEQQQAQRQQQQMQPEDRMTALGTKLFNKGFIAQGSAILKEAQGIKHQKFLEQKDQGLNRKQQAEAAKLDAQDRGKVFSGLGDNPDPAVYKAALKQIYDDTGSIPEWATGNWDQDKAFVQREAKSFGQSSDRKAAGLQHGLTENARVTAINQLHTKAQAEAKPLNESLQRTQVVRNLLQLGLPFADKQMQLQLTKLFSNVREGNLLYKEGKSFGNLPRRFEDLASRFFSGTLSDHNRKEIATVIDEMDNKVFLPELQNVRNTYRNLYKEEKLGDNPAVVDPTNITDITGGQQKGPQTSPPKQGAGGYPKVTSAEDYNKIPPGAFYLDSQGNRRQKRGQ